MGTGLQTLEKNGGQHILSKNVGDMTFSPGMGRFRKISSVFGGIYINLKDWEMGDGKYTLK